MTNSPDHRSAPTAPSAQADLDVFRRAGVDLSGPDDSRREPAGFAAALSTAAAAALLGVSPRTVRRRVANGDLLAVSGPRGLELPDWQFDEGCPLPGLRRVIASVPEGLSPEELAGFMTRGNVDLGDGAQPVSPRSWLATGGDPGLVAELLAGLAWR